MAKWRELQSIIYSLCLDVNRIMGPTRMPVSVFLISRKNGYFRRASPHIFSFFPKKIVLRNSREELPDKGNTWARAIVDIIIIIINSFIINIFNSFILNENWKELGKKGICVDWINQLGLYWSSVVNRMHNPVFCF